MACTVFSRSTATFRIIGLESEVKENEKKSLFFMAYGNSWGTIGCLDVLQPNL
jgi:hypothetical protein